MAPQKGKQGVKGAKQIVEENITTLAFYRNMGFGATIAYLLITIVFFYQSITGGIVTLIIIAIGVYVICFNILKYAAKTQYSESGQLLDSGVDLNMEGGIAEHVKDIIILTAGTQLLSLISNHFWWLLLFAPIRAGFLLWRSVLAPWFFQETPKEPEMDEKKRKKMERKMKHQRS